MSVQLDLQLLEGDYSVTLLPPDSGLPEWVPGPGFVNASFCDDELSVVTLSNRVPSRLDTDPGWRAIRLSGSFDFDQPGIVLAAVKPISEAGHAVFVVSTYHRDYTLVRSAHVAEIKALLEAAGHRFMTG